MHIRTRLKAQAVALFVGIGGGLYMTPQVSNFVKSALVSLRASVITAK